MGRLNFAKAAVTVIVFTGLFAASAAYAAPIIGLITKTEGNPYFVKMREGAQAEAQKIGVTLKTYAGFPHGMASTHPEVINADLLSFFKA